MNAEIVLFTDSDTNIEVQISPDRDTVWLTETSVGFSDKSSGGRKPKMLFTGMVKK